MSDDVNKDIMKAVQDAKGNHSGSNDSVSIPDPKVLQYSLDQDGVTIPAPTYRQDGKDKK